MSAADEWARAYARQARADFEARAVLQERTEVPVCQALHFLQMACEKLVKAHLCQAGSDPRALQSSHAYTAKNLVLVIRQQIAVLTGRRPKNVRSLLAHCKHLAREIELLSPAVDDGGRRPDNCEYPWEDSHGNLHVPAAWSFPVANLLLVPAGRSFLKLLHAATLRLARPA